MINHSLFVPRDHESVTEMQIFSVDRSGRRTCGWPPQVGKEVDEALDACRVDGAMTSKVVESLAILGRVALACRIGCVDACTAARKQGQNAEQNGFGGVKLHHCTLSARA